MLLAPCVLVLLALAIFPLAFSGTLSFKVDPLYNPDVARFVGWRNYNDLFEDHRFWNSIRLTVMWAVIVVSIQMVLGFFLAVLLDRKMQGAGLLRTLIIIPVFISPIAMGLTWRFIFEPVSGLANWILNTGFGLEKWTWISHKDTALATLMLVDCWQWDALHRSDPARRDAEHLAGDHRGGAARPGARRHLLHAHRDPADPPGHHGGDPDPLVDAIRIFDLNFIMTRGGPGSSTLLASVYDYTIFEQGHLGLMAAYGFLILILINLVVVLFSITLYRTEKAARAADQP